MPRKKAAPAEDKTGKPPAIIPEVKIQAPSKISVSSNLKAFQLELGKYLDTVPLEPKTEDDYAQAESAVKVLKKAEAALAKAEKTIIDSIPDVQAALEQVGAIRDEASDPRLALEKLLKKEKESRKQNVIQDAENALSAAIGDMETAIGAALPYLTPDFKGAVKGKRSIEGCKEACMAETERMVGEYSKLLKTRDSNMAILERLAGDRAQLLVPDIDSVVYKDTADFAALVASRLAGGTAATAKVGKFSDHAPEAFGAEVDAVDVYESSPPWEEPEGSTFDEYVEAGAFEYDEGPVSEGTDGNLQIDPDWPADLDFADSSGVAEAVAQYAAPIWHMGKAELEEAYGEYQNDPTTQHADARGKVTPAGLNVHDAVLAVASRFNRNPADVITWMLSEDFTQDLVELEGELEGAY